MPTTKARWKRAPIDQRRLAPARSAPKARFTRSQRSGSLPPSLPSLPSRDAERSRNPLLTFAGALVLTVSLSVILVIGVGMVVRAEQQYQEMQSRAAYYGLPTQPFSTLAPDAGQRVIATSAPSRATALPSIVEPIRSVSASDAALSEPDRAANDTSTTLASFCDQFGIPVSIHIFDWNDWSSVDLDNPLIAQLPIRWDASDDMWRGYQSAKPFDQPDDALDRWRLQLFTADGIERRIQIAQSASTPATLYVYAFQVITPYADSNGNHYGFHPCRAFAIPSREMDVLLSSARAYRSSGSRFPDFATSDDPRWVRGSATPLDGSFELRTIPTLSNNVPLRTLSEMVSCYFITEADWGAWAQIKLGNTTAWVDTSTVRLETAS